MPLCQVLVISRSNFLDLADHQQTGALYCRPCDSETDGELHIFIILRAQPPLGERLFGFVLLKGLF